MTVLDRMRKRQEQTGEEPTLIGQSSTPAVEPPVITRLRFVVDTLHNYIAEHDDTGAMSRFSFVTRAMIEEIGAEMGERDEETVQAFMAQIGQVIAWIGHGDASQLPESLQDFVKPKAAIESAS